MEQKGGTHPFVNLKTQCKFHHQYPVGYRASKFHFGREWQMSIEEGMEGPVFKVWDQTGKTYTGVTPTGPWTDVCLAFARCVLLDIDTKADMAERASRVRSFLDSQIPSRKRLSNDQQVISLGKILFRALKPRMCLH